MSANVFTFPSRAKGHQPWTNDELAELYRVVDLLGRAGLSVATDMGMSDEGDPWFVFCRSDNDEVIAHFARIDGIFVAASIAVDETFRGANFRQIVDRMVSSQPLVVPPPGPGSRLFLHPAVLLTAFVATALAHSEKALAQDWMRSVEAQWDHGRESAAHVLKQVKTGWADTLNTLLKLPLSDAKVAYESAKEGLNLTWASLIAIALTALQPIAEKITGLALIVDELQGYAAEAAHQTAAHAAGLLTADAPALMPADANSQTAHTADGNNSHAGADSPMMHKAAPPAALDASSSDGGKALVDAAHMAAPVVQKAAADEGGQPHLTIDSQFDANVATAAVQKIIAVAAQLAEPAIVIHIDSGSVSVPTLDLQDITADALHLLNIHADADVNATKTAEPGNPGTDTGSPLQSAAAGSSPASGQQLSHTVAPSDSTTLASSTPVATGNALGGSSSSSDSSSPVFSAVTTLANGDQVINTNQADGATVVNAISNFVTSGTHGISQQVAIADPIAQQELAGILSVYGTVKVVFFESSNPTSDVFLYSPGVVFVEEKDLALSTHLSNAGGDLILQGGAGGTITLVGVAIVSHSGTV